MDDHSIYINIVERSPLYFKIQDVAPKFFETWKNHMKKVYPDYPYDDNPEILRKEMVESFASGLESLYNNSQEERKIFGWSEGYIFGFVSSNLATHWFNKHIYCETKEFKQILFLKSIILYFQIDDEMNDGYSISRIKKLHEYLVKDSHIESSQDHQFKTCQNELEKLVSTKIISFEKFKNSQQELLTHKEFLTPFIDYLESILLKEHNKIFETLLEHNFNPDLKVFFSVDEIQTLIEFTKSNIS